MEIVDLRRLCEMVLRGSTDMNEENFAIAFCLLALFIKLIDQIYTCPQDCIPRDANFSSKNERYKAGMLTVEPRHKILELDI